MTPPLGRTCWMAWSVPPEQDPQQPTHAVDSGASTSLCGTPTTCQGAPWPAPSTPWEFPLVRCAPCETALRTPFG